MASKSQLQEGMSAKQIEELLDAVDSALDRLKTLYEQYFLGIQKQAPAFIHSDVERKLRDLTQLNIRNTGLRYRLATLQQKFGSYNSYWRRTLRQIENGTYIRNLAKIGREAIKSGSAIPEEILAAMPKRMREQVLRDRDAAIAIAKRRNQVEEVGDEDVLAGEGVSDGTVAMPPARRDVKTASGAHVLSEDDGDIDFNALFSAFDDDAPKADSIKMFAAQVDAPATPVASAPDTRSAAPAKPDAATTQTITQPVPRAPLPRTPAPPEAVETTVMPRVAAPSAQTSAIPRPIAHAPSAPVPAATARPTPTSGVPRPVGQQPSAPVPAATARPTPTSGVPRPVGQHPSGPSGAIPRPTPPAGVPTGAIPRPTPPAGIPRPAGQPPPAPTGAIPRPNQPAPSQASRPIPVMPGAAQQTGAIPVATMSGPFPRGPSETSGATTQIPKPPPARQTQPIARPQAPLKPPPGMSEADVNALHAKYVKAKEMVGEKVDANSREKLLKTITQTAPKVMEQYKASGVDFSVVVKDNQVVIKAKPKT